MARDPSVVGEERTASIDALAQQAQSYRTMTRHARATSENDETDITVFPNTPWHEIKLLRKAI